MQSIIYYRRKFNWLFDQMRIFPVLQWSNICVLLGLWKCIPSACLVCLVPYREHVDRPSTGTGDEEACFRSFLWQNILYFASTILTVMQDTWVVSSWNSWWEATLVPSTLGFPFNLFGISYFLLLYPPPPVLQSLVRGPGMGCWVPGVVRKSPNGSLTSIKSLQRLSMDNIVPIWKKLSITPLPWVLPSSLMVIPPSFSS